MIIHHIPKFIISVLGIALFVLCWFLYRHLHYINHDIATVLFIFSLLAFSYGFTSSETKK